MTSSEADGRDMHREIELKLEVEPGFSDRVRGSAPLAGIEPRVAAQHSVYFDTDRRSLGSAGFTLRIRRSDGRTVQTVKRQNGATAGLFDRAEWEWELSDERPNVDLAAGTPLQRLVGKPGIELRPVLETAFERRSWPVQHNGSLVSVTLDEGAIGGAGVDIPLVELELELQAGKASALFDLAEAIAAEVPVRIGVLSKSERGERLAAGTLGKAAKAEAMAIDPGFTVAQGFAAIAHSCLRHYRLNEPILLRGADVSALHQARVSMRRLRSSLSLFGSVLRDSRYDALREELRWFTGRLGDARNFDVFSKRLPKPGKSPRQGEAEVRSVLAEAREHAYGRALDAIRSRRVRELMLALLRWVEIGKWRGRRKAQQPLPPFAAARLDKRWAKVAEKGEILSRLGPDPLHRLRIDVKKMRYSAEFLSSLHGGKGVAGRRKRFLRAAEDLQEVLGELNDAATARELVSSLSLASPDARAFAETLIGREPDRAACISAAEKAYRKMRSAAPYWR